MDDDRAPKLLERIDRARRVVSHCSQAAIRAYDEEALLAEACRHLIDAGSYRLAWFAESVKGEDQLRTLAHSGTAPAGTRIHKLPWSSEVGPWSPTRRALVEQRPRVVRGIQGDPDLSARHPDAAALGYASVCAFPIQFGPHGAGVLTIYDREPDAFAPAEVALLRELAGDMAVGVSALRARKANDVLEEQVEIAERRFRGIIEHAPVGVLQVSAEGRILIANQSLAHLLGYPSVDVLRQGADDLERHLQPEDVERIRTALGQGPPYPVMQLALRRVDGTTVWAEVNARPANEDKGGVIEAFVRDLTSERQAQAARRDEDRQRLEVVRLQELDRMRLEFMGRASHELNTPLTPILIQVQALQGPNLDERQTRGLALIERNVRRLADLVRDLLSASTLQAREVTLEPASLDLVAKASEVAEAFRDQADRAGLALLVEAAGPVTAFADAGRVGQVLFNLVGNALKFTPRGGSVTIRCEPAEDGLSRCAVLDTGRGFDAVDQAKLFLPFGRIHEHMSGDPGGTGLGLFISQSLVEQSGGALTASSPGRNQGAAFTFTLPSGPPVEPPGRGIVQANGFHPEVGPGLASGPLRTATPTSSAAAAALTGTRPPGRPAPRAELQSAGRTRSK